MRHGRAECFEHRVPLHIDEGSLPAELQPERRKLALLATPLLLPLMARDRPLGWIALGNPHSGKAYSTESLVSLERLAHQASFALARVQTVRIWSAGSRK
jgi:hypothetical protein